VPSKNSLSKARSVIFPIAIIPLFVCFIIRA
jgi:hypothetical protein